MNCIVTVTPEKGFPVVKGNGRLHCGREGIASEPFAWKHLSVSVSL